MRHIKLLIVIGLVTAVTLWRLWHLTAFAAPTGGLTRHVAVGGSNAPSDCANPNQPCGSVAYAVQQAEAGDTVLIAAGTYTETAMISVFREMTIQGMGSEATIVAVVNGVDHVFQVFDFSGQATIQDLSLRNAQDSGVQNIGRLALEQVHIGPNQNGGVYNSGGAVLTMTNSVVADNTSLLGGGGLINFGQATINRSLFARNIVTTSYGGGLHNQGQMSLENVTFAHNEAQSGTALNNSGTLMMTNVTVAENQRNGSTQTPASAVTNYGTLSAQNSLIVNNGPNGQCDGDQLIVSLGYNIENHHSCNFVQMGDQNDTYPTLGSLGNYGGANGVAVFGFSSSNPAIDAGSPTVCPATDARGEQRPFDGNGDGSPRCDVGAFEYRGDSLFLPFIVR